MILELDLLGWICHCYNIQLICAQTALRQAANVDADLISSDPNENIIREQVLSTSAMSVYDTCMLHVNTSPTIARMRCDVWSITKAKHTGFSEKSVETSFAKFLCSGTVGTVGTLLTSYLLISPWPWAGDEQNAGCR